MPARTSRVTVVVLRGGLEVEEVEEKEKEEEIVVVAARIRRRIPMAAAAARRELIVARPLSLMREKWRLLSLEVAGKLELPSWTRKRPRETGEKRDRQKESDDERC